MKPRVVSLKAQTQSYDKRFLYIALGLVFFGIAMVFDASSADSARTFGDIFFFAKRQIIWVTLGLITFFICSKIKYTFWQKHAISLFILTVILLILVFIPGLGVQALGAKRRIGLGEIGIQPSELAKLTLSIFLAASLSRKANIKRFFVPVGIIALLVVLQPDLGTTIILSGLAFAIYFASGASLVHISLLGMAGILIALALSLTSDYRRERVMSFLNPHNDPINSSYHIRQILIALGSGGLFGLGIGQSRQKHLFLPEPATDSVFAVIAEELGFIGAAALVLVFLYLIWLGYKIAINAEDEFGKLLAVGITSWIGIQTFVNLAAMVALVPLTGIPLPFISYGGSSIIVLFGATGILLNISKYRKKVR